MNEIRGNELGTYLDVWVEKPRLELWLKFDSCANSISSDCTNRVDKPEAK
jgi:hypothetical protein